jgi:glycosyltransferase involved in cell wall biosynthesis
VEYTKRDRGVGGDPLVSIVIPAYTPRFFAACLDSALAQTYANTEIIVCDDSDGSEIEATARARAKRRDVRYLRNAVRLGPRGNFIKCFESARGEFVKFLCDDDLLAPTCVSSLLDAFRRARYYAGHFTPPAHRRER